MDNIIAIIIVVLVLIGYYFLDKKLKSTPSYCPKCKKEVKELEHWSYGDYLWGMRCPHCKHEYDVTP